MTGLVSQRTASQIRETISGWRAAGDSIALVPTMGNLHRGHLSLTELAAQHADRVILTIFVNPTQFGGDEDFDAYPRTLVEDRALLHEAGTVDGLFVPDVSEIYPHGIDGAFRLEVPALGAQLCGASRPGHFDGVAGVVLRLLNITAPDMLVLGQKDYQQLRILERMIADLRLPVAVIPAETQREDDGLAISSRNAYLTAEDRTRAPLLRKTLEEVGAQLANGDRDFETLQKNAMERLAENGFRPDYVEVRRARDLSLPDSANRSDELIVLAAAWLGRARLIDNLIPED